MKLPKTYITPKIGQEIKALSDTVLLLTSIGHIISIVLSFIGAEDICKRIYKYITKDVTKLQTCSCRYVFNSNDLNVFFTQYWRIPKIPKNMELLLAPKSTVTAAKLFRIEMQYNVYWTLKCLSFLEKFQI